MSLRAAASRARAPGLGGRLFHAVTPPALSPESCGTPAAPDLRGTLAKSFGPGEESNSAILKLGRGRLPVPPPPPPPPTFYFFSFQKTFFLLEGTTQVDSLRISFCTYPLAKCMLHFNKHWFIKGGKCCHLGLFDRWTLKTACSCQEVTGWGWGGSPS